MCATFLLYKPGQLRVFETQTPLIRLVEHLMKPLMSHYMMRAHLVKLQFSLSSCSTCNIKRIKYRARCMRVHVVSLTLLVYKDTTTVCATVY